MRIRGDELRYQSNDQIKQHIICFIILCLIAILLCAGERIFRKNTFQGPPYGTTTSLYLDKMVFA